MRVDGLGDQLQKRKRRPLEEETEWQTAINSWHWNVSTAALGFFLVCTALPSRSGGDAQGVNEDIELSGPKSLLDLLALLPDEADKDTFYEQDQSQYLLRSDALMSRFFWLAQDPQ